ncbi:hypothetical protein ACKVEX_15215 [Rhodocyclaceae bacterium SMB388]
MTDEKNARCPEGSTSATLKRNFKRIHAGLLAEWLVILAVCIGILLLSGVAR